jgi:hypothetical protein
LYGAAVVEPTAPKMNEIFLTQDFALRPTNYHKPFKGQVVEDRGSPIPAAGLK